MHLTLLVVLPAFVWLTWWQFERATHGNTLSWAYTFEWPLFAAYACYVWWQLIHDEPAAIQRRRAASGVADEPLGPQDEVGWALKSSRDRRRERSTDPVTVGGASGSGTPGTPADRPGDAAGGPHPDDVAAEDDLDPELAEYNRYLAELNAGPDPRKW